MHSMWTFVQVFIHTCTQAALKFVQMCIHTCTKGPLAQLGPGPIGACWPNWVRDSFGPVGPRWSRAQSGRLAHLHPGPMDPLAQLGPGPTHFWRGGTGALSTKYGYTNIYVCRSLTLTFKHLHVGELKSSNMHIYTFHASLFAYGAI